MMKIFTILKTQSITILLIILLLTLTGSSVYAQRYLTLSLGYSAALLGSDELNLFKDTYNGIWGPDLYRPLKGFGASVGIRWAVGYRRWAPINLGISVGSLNFSSTDEARFYNASRQFKLDVKTWFIDFEAGKSFKKLFINGALSVCFKRDVTLQSVYSTAIEEKQALDGTYTGLTAVSSDIGLVVGFFKEPVFISAKVTYPLFTGGGSRMLQDRSPEKLEEGTYIFPDDYEAYLYSEGYRGVKSNIDGLKILMMAEFAIKIDKFIDRLSSHKN